VILGHRRVRRRVISSMAARPAVGEIVMRTAVDRVSSFIGVDGTKPTIRSIAGASDQSEAAHQRNFLRRIVIARLSQNSNLEGIRFFCSPARPDCRDRVRDASCFPIREDPNSKSWRRITRQWDGVSSSPRLARCSERPEIRDWDRNGDRSRYGCGILASAVLTSIKRSTTRLDQRQVSTILPPLLNHTTGVEVGVTNFQA